MLYVRDYLTDQTVLRSPAAPESPLVSVILPTYKRFKSGRLKKAVDSVLSQSFSDFELIVVDDGSTDGSNQFIEQCRAADPRIIHVRHESNSGLPALRVNEGIELARGQYIAFQFDDDSWRPHALEALVRASENHPVPTVIVGHAQGRGPAIERLYPDGQPELFSLYETNFIANNSVLLHRSLADRYGMLDCHIAMRRICDWDLWVRYVRHCPFVVIDEVVSDVALQLPDSVGMTVPHGFSLVRFFQSVARDRLLTPATWRNYEVDSLHAGNTRIDGVLRERLYDEQILPYYLKHRHQFPQIENFPTAVSTDRKILLYTKDDRYDPLYEILIQYNESLTRRQSYVSFFQLQTQMMPGWQREADILLLIRSFREPAINLLEEALSENKAVGYFLDDDFLTLHECGPEFQFLAPGSHERECLTRLLTESDAVWVTAPSIRESVNQLNPRTVPYHGGIIEEALPAEIRPRDPDKPIRFGCTSGPYREQELRCVWESLVRLSDTYRDRIIFEFWGVDTKSMPALASPVVNRSFTHSYTLFVEQLRKANFDVFLAPLLDEPRARRGKAPNKYYLSAVAGALGIFSDVQPYEMLPHGLTCLKTRNTVEDWYAALRTAIEMPPADFDLMRQRMLEHVRQDYTETAQINVHEAAIRATEFHAQTRAIRHSDGRPRIVFYCRLATSKTARADLSERIKLVRNYGIEPVIIFETSSSTSNGNDLEHAARFHGAACRTISKLKRTEEFCNELKQILEDHNPAIVHSLVFAPRLARVCRELNIAHVSAPTDLNSETKWQAGFRYADIVQSDTLNARANLAESLSSKVLCSRGFVAAKFFEIGRRRYLEGIGNEGNHNSAASRVMLFERPADSQNGDSAPEIVTYLRARHVDCDFEIHDHDSDRIEALEHADILLAGGENFPREIKQAMASGVLVVTGPSEGTTELIIDGVTGIVCEDKGLDQLEAGLRRALALSNEDRREVVERARRIARVEFHPGRGANDLFLMCNQAIERAVKPGHGYNRRLPEIAARAEIVDEPMLPPISHMLVSKSLRFSVVPNRENWAGLDVVIGTHARPAHGRLRLRLRTADGKVIREAAQELAQVEDNGWASFRFDPIPEAATRVFIADFALYKLNRDTRVSIYQNTPAENRLRRVMRRAGVRGVRHDLFCRMYYEV